MIGDDMTGDDMGRIDMKYDRMDNKCRSDITL